MSESPDSLRVLAIVPAHGGSRVIPRKNTRVFSGHPLVAWSIAAGLQSRYVQRVIVSTDDRQIAEASLAYGAEVPFVRPAELSQDDTSEVPVFEHALEWLERNEDYRPDVVVQLRPTSPMRPPGLVDEAIGCLLADDCGDSVRTVTPAYQSPYRMWSLSSGAMRPIMSSSLHEPYNATRQSLPESYWQTGHVDVVWNRTIQRKRSLSGDRILPVIVDPRYAFDIEDPIHWRLAELWLEEQGLALVGPRNQERSVLAGVRLLVFDFDGVFTDNRVYVDEDGAELVSCSRSDGLGIERLLSHGIDAAVLSTEVNSVVTARCRKLNLPVRQGLSNKADVLREIVSVKGLTLDQVAYVGNDVNDLECLQVARVAVVPADAHPSARKIADYVLHSRGGHGAVREVCELAIASYREKEIA
jgi:N-acylneuraminate cytidylyltransferase